MSDLCKRLEEAAIKSLPPDGHEYDFLGVEDTLEGEAIAEITRLRAQRDDNEVRAAIGRVFQKQRDLPLCIGRRFLLDLADEPAVCRFMVDEKDRFRMGAYHSMRSDAEAMGAALKALAKECGE